MTKIKNTKKGMAKKTLSMSLVVAMLATSNVPVWAAEFSDGSNATEVSTETPVAEAEVFSDNAVTDTETPATEEAEDIVNAQKADSTYYIEELKQATSVDWKGHTFNDKGESTKVLVSGKVIDQKTGTVATTPLKYVWAIDGKWLTTSASNVNANNLSSVVFPSLTAEHVGKKLELYIVESADADKDGETVCAVNFGTIKAVDVSKDLGDTAITGVSFDGTEKKSVPTNMGIINDITVDAGNFDWSYSGTKGLISGGSVITATGKVKADVAQEKGITGEITTKYTIAKATKFDTNKVTISAKDKTKTYTYTGTNVQVPLDDVTVTYGEDKDNKIAGYDLSSYVKEVITTKEVTGETGFTVVWDTDKFKESTNKDGDFNLNNTSIVTRTIRQDKLSKITVLDLSDGCTVEVSKSYTQVPTLAALKKDITVYKNGVALSLKDSDYDIAYAEDTKNYVNPDTYTGAIVLTGKAPNVKGSVSGDLIITVGSFDNATFKDSSVDYPITLTDTADKALKLTTGTMEYTGKAPTYGQTIGGVKTVLGGFYLAGESKPLDESLYDVTFENVDSISTKDHVAKVTITGKSSYKGCKRVLYFKIVPAKLTADATKNSATNSVVVSDGVEENKAYTKAADYKNDINFALTAKATEAIKKDNKDVYTSIDLKEGTDYTVDSYSFVDDNGHPWTSNSTGKWVKFEATITNTNVDGVVGNNVKFGDNVKVTVTPADASKKAKVTVSVKVVAKSINKADVTLEKSSYTYTGKDIVPNVTVSLGGKTLEKGKDYSVTVDNAKNAGSDAKVIVKGIGDYAGTVEKSFTIEKADVKDLTITLTEGKIVEYTGSQCTPKLSEKFDIKLGDNKIDASEFINDATKKGNEVTYGDNINAGEKTGKLTITAGEKNKNFTGSVDVVFEITPATVTATDETVLSIYNKYGKKLTNSNLPSLAWNGNAVTFTKTEVDLSKLPANPVKLTNDDVEVVYVNNIDKTVKDKEAYVALIGKGNYTGKYSIVKVLKAYNNKAVGDIICEETATVKKVNKAKDTAGTYEILQSGVIGTNSKAVAYTFDITGGIFTAKNVTVKDGVYAGGLEVTPVVNVIVDGKTLVEGTDYKVETTADDKVNVTGKDIKVKIVGLGQYNGTEISKDINNKDLVYKVTKKDLKDCTVSVDKAGKVTVMNGNVLEEKENFDVKDNGDGTVTVSVVNGGKNYTGSVTIDKGFTKVGAPIISNVKVVGNKATVILSGDVEGASGYDYVISTDKDCITNKQYDAVDKNKAKTTTSFKYVNQGTYYAYCHAWTRDENGKKVFGEWSNAYPFSVEAVTPDAPVITNVKVSGSTIKVTYNAAANAAGYDVVLGTSSKKDNGELRPYNYGSHKVLNIKEGTVTATFKNVPAGTWTVGMHAFSRDPETNKKVFSPWSNLKTAKVK